jgi:hypothetical protein
MYVILIALSSSLLFFSFMSSSRLMSLRLVTTSALLGFSTGILFSTHVLSPNLPIVNCALSKIKPAVQIGSGLSGSETVCIFLCARAYKNFMKQV